jgi:aminoglycoside phosphotransferase (APT) family kinase protein
MGLKVPEARAELARFLADAAGAERVEIEAIVALPGGTVNENWRLDVDISDGPERDTRRLVLRTDRVVNVAGSLSRCEEFAVMKAAHGAGVTLPEPLWAAAANGPLGREFFIMRFVPGTASPPAIVHDETLSGPHERLAERLGEELARLQTLTPASAMLPFLPRPEAGLADRIIGDTRELLDTFDAGHPAVEWGLRWLELNAPPPGDLVLMHGDYRTGNYLVDGEGLAAILDWELARWGDPLEDVGWFFMRFWRLDQPHKEAGGIAGRDVFLRGYERVSHRTVERDAVRYWEIMANVRWAAISIQQARRHLSGLDKSLELCLTGRRTAELEFEALRLIEQAA